MGPPVWFADNKWLEDPIDCEFSQVTDHTDTTLQSHTSKTTCSHRPHILPILDFVRKAPPSSI